MGDPFLRFILLLIVVFCVCLCESEREGGRRGEGDLKGEGGEGGRERNLKGERGGRECESEREGGERGI